MGKHSEIFNTEIKNIKKLQTKVIELNNTITELKNILGVLIRR